jgi:hypothetical protein
MPVRRLDRCHNDYGENPGENDSANQVCPANYVLSYRHAQPSYRLRLTGATA